MAVSPIRQLQSTQQEKPAANSDQPGEKRSVKRRRDHWIAPARPCGVTQGTPPVATTENYAGYEQKRKPSEHESMGTRVNVYA
jgi:hypothetical protein